MNIPPPQPSDVSGQDTVAPVRRWNVLAWLRDLALSVAVSGFIIIFLYQPVRVEGTSMLPMLEDQDRLFINKLAFRVGERWKSMVSPCLSTAR